MSPTRKTASRQILRKPLWMLSLLALYQFTGCSVQTRTEDDDTTNTFVRVTDMQSGDTDMGEDVFSDVCGGTTPDVCTVFNDNAEVTMTAQPKDLAQISSIVQDVVFTRYRVTYIRADGRNVAGVDVPFPFDGVLNFRVPIDGTEVTQAFMIVRQQAKLESPLAEMAFGGGAQVLSVLARVDFFGQDIAGRNIEVSGFINITFADFANN